MSLKYTFNTNDTICAISTPPGIGAIAIIRISGRDSRKIISEIFKSFNKSLSELTPNTLIYGNIFDNDELLDSVLVSFFKSPHSYTGEDMVEINCHGSAYIQQKIIELLLSKGLRHASPGEFTLRAFLNKKLDLSQAEAIADLIAAQSKSAHKLALDQMRGGFSEKINSLRKKLIDFASLIELELDFSEEDVEFADRNDFLNLLKDIKNEVKILIDSFAQGNVIKNGIPVAIIGKPNVGKSTLLNALVNEERAIVSEIPGTTRDTIEDVITIRGVSFRFIDTAGLRVSENEIEQIGIEKTYQKIAQAHIVLYVTDITETSVEQIKNELEDFRNHLENPDKKFIIIANKIDKLSKTPTKFSELVELETIFVSAKRKENIHLITDSLLRHANEKYDSGIPVVSNIRHLQALNKVLEAISAIEEGLQNNVSTDLLTSDIHSALHYLGEITGTISTEDILGNIFEKFCIGK